jgi:hypothetical protein
MSHLAHPTHPIGEYVVVYLGRPCVADFPPIVGVNKLIFPWNRVRPIRTIPYLRMCPPCVIRVAPQRSQSITIKCIKAPRKILLAKSLRI